MGSFLPPPPAYEEPSDGEYVCTPQSSECESEGVGEWPSELWSSRQNTESNFERKCTEHPPGNCPVCDSEYQLERSSGRWMAQCFSTDEDGICGSAAIEIPPPACPQCGGEMIWPEYPKVFLSCNECKSQTYWKNGTKSYFDWGGSSGAD